MVSRPASSTAAALRKPKTGFRRNTPSTQKQRRPSDYAKTKQTQKAERRVFHGNNFPYIGKKLTLTEGGLRTPLLIQWPDAALNGQVISETVGIEDLYPTLLSAIEVPLPANLDAESFFTSIETRQRQFATTNS